MSRVARAVVPLAAATLLGLAGCRDDGAAARTAPGPARPATGASSGLLDGIGKELDAVERDVGLRDPDAGGGSTPAR